MSGKFPIFIVLYSQILIDREKYQCPHATNYNPPFNAKTLSNKYPQL